MQNENLQESQADATIDPVLLSADPSQQPQLPAVRTDPNQFDYGYTIVKDIQVETEEDPTRKRRRVTGVVVNEERVEPSQRFWTSLQALYGFNSNIFTYFSHEEVFDRISQVSPNDRVRVCVHRQPNQAPTLLAATRPEKAVITYDMLMETLQQYHGENIRLLDGMVSSTHTPRIGGDNWMVGPDALVNRFTLDVPVDGYGKPAAYLSCVRLVCENGAIARAPAFKTELTLGKGGDVVRAAVIRALESFNDDAGYAAMRNRFAVSAQSWASVLESSNLLKLLVRLHACKQILGAGSAEPVDPTKKGFPLLTRFHEVTGDATEIYGLANLDALSRKKQSALPVNCTVYDLINLATEVATHHSTESGRQQLHGWVGMLIGNAEGYDLEGTKEQWGDFRSFFLDTELGSLKGKAASK